VVGSSAARVRRLQRRVLRILIARTQCVGEPSSVRVRARDERRDRRLVSGLRPGDDLFAGHDGLRDVS
jgi:hypothetical protein